MIGTGIERVDWHLDVPVCEMLSGLKIHLACCGMAERWHLCFILRCTTTEQLCKEMWARIKARKKDHKKAHKKAY